MKYVAILSVALTASLAGQGSPQTNGSFSLIAGDGQVGYSPDGMPAVDAALNDPTAVALTPSGSIVFADRLNYLVRTVTSSGNLLTIAGNGCGGGFSGFGCFNGDGGPAASASIGSVYGLATDALGNIYIADSPNQRIRKVSVPGNIIRTIAGTGAVGFFGDGGPAVGASLNWPRGLAVDQSGNVFFADTLNHRVRRIDSQGGTITTIAGTGVGGFSGDHGLAVNAALFGPTSVSLDGAGNLFIADSGNNRVREVSSDGTITTAAGNGLSRFAGDGGLATAASLNNPLAVSSDQMGNFYIADFNNAVVRKVTRDGYISSLAYGGGPYFLAPPRAPWGLAADRSGNVFISDESRNQIAEFIPTSVTIASVVNGASFAVGGAISTGSWATIFGTGLAPAGDSRKWNEATEIVNGKLPVCLDGTSVTVNGKPAAVEFVQPSQVNIQPPDDNAVGPVQVIVNTAAGASDSFTVNYAKFAPGLFPAASPYVVAQHADYSYVTTSTPAKPGEVIILWGTGFGPANPAVPAGRVFSGANPLDNTVTVTIGGQTAVVDFAGVVGAGLVQINVHVPSSISNGDAAVVASVGGVSTQTTANLISIHN